MSTAAQHNIKNKDNRPVPNVCMQLALIVTYQWMHDVVANSLVDLSHHHDQPYQIRFVQYICSICH